MQSHLNENGNYTVQYLNGDTVSVIPSTNGMKNSKDHFIFVEIWDRNEEEPIKNLPFHLGLRFLNFKAEENTLSLQEFLNDDELSGIE